MGRLEIFFDISLYGYLLATLVFGIWFFWRIARLWWTGAALLGLGFLSQVVFIVGRGVAAGRPPLANTFETLVFLAACVACMFLVSAWLFEWKSLSPFAALATFFVTLFAYLTMQEEIEPLVPALRDNFWLTVHVVFCFVSYAAFLLGYICALAHLVRTEKHAVGAALVVALNLTAIVAGVALAFYSRRPQWQAERFPAVGAVGGVAIVAAFALWPLVGWVGRKLRLAERLPDDEQVGRMVYKAVAFGFPFLTLGIVTGSVWANQAWGRYWGWDDKEVASLVTWLVFAIFLHLRLVPRWRGPWLSWIPVVGFWCVLFTYFGVNYLSDSLHSYA